MVVHSSKDIVASGLTVTGESDRQEGICSGSFSGSWDAVRRQTATERVAATSRYLCCVAENDRCRQRVNECPPDWGPGGRRFKSSRPDHVLFVQDKGIDNDDAPPTRVGGAFDDHFDDLFRAVPCRHWPRLLPHSTV
jgi:hypothetical protein